MTKALLSILVIWAAALTSITSAVAQRPDVRKDDEAAIHRVGQEYLAAIEKGDPKAIAAFWTADGTYTDEKGHSFNSREVIEQSFSSKKAARPRIQLDRVEIRFLTPDVAIQEGTCRLQGGANAISGCFSAVWVRKENAWKLASLRESRIDATPAASDRLAALEHFVGNWKGESDKFSVQISAKWNAGKTYLVRNFVAMSEGKEVFRGSQYVGWDPKHHEIRSWTFNDDGGYAEGLWSLEGNVWMVASSNVGPGGETVKMTQTYKFAGRDTLLWKVRTTADESPSTVFEVKLSREK